MGGWNFGRLASGQAQPFTTFAYGHPRLSVIQALTNHIPGYRSQQRKARVATGARRFQDYVVRKRIYATAWDETVRVRATLERAYRVTVGH